MAIGFPWINNKTIITLNEFLTNPSGKRTSYGAKRENIIKDLNRRYDNILKNNKNTLNYTVYHDANNYFFIFKIPSESFPNLYYDVAIQFSPVEKKDINSSSLLNYALNFFSNSPHMTFTYTYVLQKEKLLVDFIKEYKCSQIALKTPPKVTNPVEQFGFEKTCYFACLYIKNHKLYEKASLNKAIIPTKNTKTEILNNIMTQDAKLIQYNHLKEADIEAKRKANQKAKNDKIKDINKKSFTTYGMKKKSGIQFRYKGKNNFKSPIKNKK